MIRYSFNKMLSAAAVLFFYINAAQAQDVKTIQNLNASKGVVYFNLATGKEVPPDKAASADWDLSFAKTTISVNSAKANITAQVTTPGFESLTKAPAAGYKKDSEEGKAIPTGSGNGWYNYNMEDHTIEPIIDRTIVIKGQDKKYYKLQVISYNKDGKAFEPSGYYSFRYAAIEAAK